MRVVRDESRLTRRGSSRGAGCGRRRRRRLASANRGDRGAANEGRDGCGRRAGGALPQEEQPEGKDGGRVPRVIRRPETPTGPAGHQGRKDQGRCGLCAPVPPDARRFGSVSGSSADADDALSATQQDTPRPVGLRTWWIELTRVRGRRTGNRERLAATEARRESNGARRSSPISRRKGATGGGAGQSPGGGSRVGVTAPRPLGYAPHLLESSRDPARRAPSKRSLSDSARPSRMPSPAITEPRSRSFAGVLQRAEIDEHRGARRTQRHGRRAARFGRREPFAVPRSPPSYTGEFDPPRSQPHWPWGVLLRGAQCIIRISG